MKFLQLLLLVVALFGSAGAARAGLLRLTLVSAQLGKVKPKAHAHAAPAPDERACLTLPGLRGKPCPGEGAALNPLVRVELGGRQINSYAIPHATAPQWGYAAILDSEEVLRCAFVDFVLFDQHEGQDALLLGGKRIKPQELVQPGTRRLRLGAAELLYRVEPVGEGAAQRFRVPVSVPEELLRGAALAGPKAEGYRLLPVAEGEEVQVRIEPALKARRPGVAAKGAALSAVLAGEHQRLGTEGEHRFVAKRSGLLGLVVEGVQPGDYQGGFDVEVKIEAKAAPAPAATSAPNVVEGGKGKGADKEQGAKLLVQRVLDAHADEVDACTAGEQTLTGEVVMLFTISKSGAPLGVVVEKAAPSLQKVGDCIRRKALRWRFPAPPGGVLSARYPIQFNTQEIR